MWTILSNSFVQVLVLIVSIDSYGLPEKSLSLHHRLTSGFLSNSLEATVGNNSSSGNSVQCSLKYNSESDDVSTSA